MRKSPAPPSFRPVNIVQHEDAGPSGGPEEAETIELPPAYTNIRSAAPTTAATSTTEGPSDPPPPPADTAVSRTETAQA